MMIDMFRNSDGYEEDMIVNNAQALEMVSKVLTPVLVMKLLVSIIIPEYMQSASSGRSRRVFKDEVYVMGHRMGDADSFGASVGIYRIARTLDKPAHIVLNDICSCMAASLRMITKYLSFSSFLQIPSSAAIYLFTK